MAEWREEDHPRKDDGEFTKKLNAALDKSSDELRNEQRREIREPEPTVVDAATGKPKTKKLSTYNVSRQEWARYYEQLGFIKAGTFSPMKTEDGGNVIRIDNKLFFDNGDFENPKVKKVYQFKSDDDIDKFIKVFKGKGVLK